MCAGTPAQLGWATVWVHWCHTGEAEPTGTAAGRLEITFIFLQAASPKGRLTGMALRAVQWGCEQQQQGTPRRQGHPQPFSPGEEEQIPALSCAEQM